MKDGRLTISCPMQMTELDRMVVELYDKTPRSKKSQEMMALLKGGLVLKELGLLESAIAIHSCQSAMLREALGQAVSSRLLSSSKEEQTSQDVLKEEPAKTAVDGVTDAISHKGTEETAVSAAGDSLSLPVDSGNAMSLQEEPVIAPRKKVVQKSGMAGLMSNFGGNG